MGNVESDERPLWAESLRGNGDAFGKLFDRYRERVFRHAYRLTADRHDAEDVLATAFLELWRNRHRVRQRMKNAITGSIDAKSIPALEGGK